MVKNVPLTLADRKKIKMLLRKGFCFRDIANTLGRAVSTISIEVKRGGGRDAYEASIAHLKAKNRSSKNYRIITDDDRREIKRLLKMGTPKLDICAQLDLGRNRLYREMKAGGWPKEYNVSRSKRLERFVVEQSLRRSWRTILKDLFFQTPLADNGKRSKSHS